MNTFPRQQRTCTPVQSTQANKGQEGRMHMGSAHPEATPSVICEVAWLYPRQKALFAKEALVHAALTVRPRSQCGPEIAAACRRCETACPLNGRGPP
eukprot:1160277-Pelagomonas_calceolata.AAC.24